VLSLAAGVFNENVHQKLLTSAECSKLTAPRVVAERGSFERKFGPPLILVQKITVFSTDIA